MESLKRFVGAGSRVGSAAVGHGQTESSARHCIAAFFLHSTLTNTVFLNCLLFHCMDHTIKWHHKGVQYPNRTYHISPTAAAFRRLMCTDYAMYACNKSALGQCVCIKDPNTISLVRNSTVPHHSGDQMCRLFRSRGVPLTPQAVSLPSIGSRLHRLKTCSFT